MPLLSVDATPHTSRGRSLAGGCLLVAFCGAVFAGGFSYGDWVVSSGVPPSSVGTRVVQSSLPPSGPALAMPALSPAPAALGPAHRVPETRATPPPRAPAAQTPAPGEWRADDMEPETTPIPPARAVAKAAGAYTAVKHARGRECSDQSTNFGYVRTPEQCDVLTVKSETCGAFFMFSADHPDWACRCCAPDGENDGPASPVWDVFSVQGDLPAHRRPGAAPVGPVFGLPSPAPAGTYKAKYGFYIHCFRDPAAVIHQVRELKKFFPTSPIYLMSDGGMDFGELCKKEHCTFRMCPPANDRWHPWPFFKRIVDAAIALQSEYLIMLEPDNTVHGQITREPTHGAGGLYVSGRGFGCRETAEALAQERVPGFKWTDVSMRAGLAGGAYFRADAIFDAFSDESMNRLDWNYIADKCSKEIFSSDFAMQYALAARGWPVHAWHDCSQMDKDKDIPLTGPKDAAFRHYCSCYPGGKPTYNLHVNPADHSLFKEPPRKYGQHGSVCQLCYNHTRYVELWGSDECTNRKPFEYSSTLLKRHHPEVKPGHCPHDLKWFCTR